VIEELRASVKDEASEEALDEQLKLAVVERDAQSLERALARFASERGRSARALAELVGAGYVPRLPEDPFGGTYVVGEDGKVRSSANPFRFQLREGPQLPGFQYEIPENELRRMPE
jgi:hypothetical protein